MKILIMGGDGFCGWPTALHLSAGGHDVAIVDNLSRRRIDAELGVQSLTPILPIEERLAAWRELSGRTIGFTDLTLGAEFDRLTALFETTRPDAVVHFAEQRSAPYSMKSAEHKRYTVANNLNATHDLLAAIVASGRDIHLVHLGSMGVYGYDSFGASIPEGYLEVTVAGQGGAVSKEILHPTKPGSIYHLTKSQDQLFFEFYNRNDGVRITDLHQGVVWGTQTEQTRIDDRLINRFDYDGDFGTVLNRFLVQAAAGVPLTVHGSGGQKRGFIHIQDTVRCIQLALDNPPAAGDRVTILNQLTEVHRVQDLARLVSELSGAAIASVPNPREEAEANELEVAPPRLLDLGLEPTTLQAGLLIEIQEVASRYIDRCDPEKIPCRSYWNRRAERRARAAEPLHRAPAPRRAEA